MIEHKDKIEYLAYEVKNFIFMNSCFVFNTIFIFKLQRYEAYADRLQRHFQQLRLDRPFVKIDNDVQQHPSFIGPIEALSGVHNTPHQILPIRSTPIIGYKKTLPSTNITMTNPNRYSYMMAVNTHPVLMKEHRL
jgi:hypothetical protein